MFTGSQQCLRHKLKVQPRSRPEKHLRDIFSLYKMYCIFSIQINVKMRRTENWLNTDVGIKCTLILYNIYSIYKRFRTEILYIMYRLCKYWLWFLLSLPSSSGTPMRSADSSRSCRLDRTELSFLHKSLRSLQEETFQRNLSCLLSEKTGNLRNESKRKRERAEIKQDLR